MDKNRNEKNRFYLQAFIVWPAARKERPKNHQRLAKNLFFLYSYLMKPSFRTMYPDAEQNEAIADSKII